MSTKELERIGQLLGVSVGTVKDRLEARGVLTNGRVSTLAKRLKLVRAGTLTTKGLGFVYDP